MTTAQIIASAQKLSLAERYAIAEALLESIEPMQPAIESAWLAESQDRVKAFDAGHMPTGDLQAVLAAYRT